MPAITHDKHLLRNYFLGLATLLEGASLTFDIQKCLEEKVNIQGLTDFIP